MGAVFPNRAGNVYTAGGFATMWQKLMVAAIEAGEVKQRFNFRGCPEVLLIEQLALCQECVEMPLTASERCQRLLGHIADREEAETPVTQRHQAEIRCRSRNGASFAARARSTSAVSRCFVSVEG
jgi:hypothetical protein